MGAMMQVLDVVGGLWAGLVSVCGGNWMWAFGLVVVGLAVGLALASKK